MYDPSHHRSNSLVWILDRVPVQYQKSYLDLGFWYSICPTQPIFTNTETAMLSNEYLLGDDRRKHQQHRMSIVTWNISHLYISQHIRKFHNIPHTSYSKNFHTRIQNWALLFRMWDKFNAVSNQSKRKKLNAFENNGFSPPKDQWSRLWLTNTALLSQMQDIYECVILLFVKIPNSS